MVDEETTNYLDGVVGVVEANSFEHHALWRFNNERLDGRKMPWVETGNGYGPTVGEIDGRPVCISALTATVDGHKLLFYYAMSTAVDHDQVRTWLEKNLPTTAFEGGDPRKRLNHTDAMNFYNVFPSKAA